MRIAPVLVVAAVACGPSKKDEPQPAPPPPAAAVDAAPPPVDADPTDAAPPPLTPPVPSGKVGLQVIDLEYGGIVASGLPAISPAGDAIVVVRDGDDGGRGYLDVSIEVLDGASGKPTKTIVVGDPDKYSDLQDRDPVDTAGIAALEKEVRDRVAAVNTLVAAWRPIPGTVPLQVSDSMDYENQLTHGDITYELAMAKRVVTLRRSGRSIGAKSVADLYKLPRRGDPEASCVGDLPFLRAVYTDAQTARALIEIGFVPGGHNCGAAGSRYAVVAIPPP